MVKLLSLTRPYKAGEALLVYHKKFIAENASDIF